MGRARGTSGVRRADDAQRRRYVERIVDEAPPITAGQAQRLRALLPEAEVDLPPAVTARG